jgi:phosphopantothenoylcysteine decarboxylase/phosphopantothenate--cysteine ligase
MKGKKILIGITGGIAAYKVPQLIRDLRRSGAEVRVVMTEPAKEFVTPLTLSTVSGNDVIVGTFPKSDGSVMKAGTWHIDLAQEMDCMLIAPATANTLAKIAGGIADNAVITLALAMRGPVVLSPSMDSDMLLREATQENMRILRERGYVVLPPGEGELASGLKGPGRLPDLPVIQQAIQDVLNRTACDLKGKKVLITAGPTYEAIDPVRFISNRSTGTMGFALANAAAQRGAEVTLIAGPVSRSTPRHVKRIDVETAAEMQREIKKSHKTYNIIIMAAAVSDFRPVDFSKQKIKKEYLKEDGLVIKLKKNPDILAEIGTQKGKSILIGFALETQHGIVNAKKKLRQKNLDLIVLNNPLQKGAGFGTDTNIVTIISRSGKVERLKKMSKFDTAHEILNRIVKIK